MTHYFDIAHEQFCCNLETEYKKNGKAYWMPSNNSGHYIDTNKAFSTKEACEKYMRKQVKKYCKELLNGVESHSWSDYKIKIDKEKQ